LVSESRKLTAERKVRIPLVFFLEVDRDRIGFSRVALLMREIVLQYYKYVNAAQAL